LTALLLVAMAWAVGVGAVHIAAQRVAQIVGQALLGPLGGHLGLRPLGPGTDAALGATTWQTVIVLQARLPRVLVAALVGAALSTSGAALQALFGNPLAEPSVLGVTSGASLGAVVAIFTGLAAHSVWYLPLFACGAALATTAAVYAIAARATRFAADQGVGTLLLGGIAVGQVAVAATSLIVSLALANWDIGRQVLYWMMGGLEGRTWDHVRLAALPILATLGVLFAHARPLDALLLGDTHAVAVGIDVLALRRRLVVATAVLGGLSVAVAGSVGFVGLVVPHVLRRRLGPRHQRLLPASALGGALFVVVADLVARTAIAPEELRLGVVTAALGAPLFIYLLLRRYREVAS
jgi:iron complex transport system permease protein